MQTLFINSTKSLNEIAETVFSVLEIGKTHEGDSSFSPKGYYFEGNVLGLAIKIDANNYDYEDQYNYMISIKEAIGTKLYDDNALAIVAEIVAAIISVKLGIEVALELELRRSKEMNLKVFSYDGSKVVTNLKA